MTPERDLSNIADVKSLRRQLRGATFSHGRLTTRSTPDPHHTDPRSAQEIDRHRIEPIPWVPSGAAHVPLVCGSRSRGRIHLAFGPDVTNLPDVAQCWPISAEVVQRWPQFDRDSARLGRLSCEFGQHLLSVDQSWPKFGQRWSKLGRIRPKSGQFFSEIHTQIWPKLIDLFDVGQARATCGPEFLLNKKWAKFGPNRASSGQHWSNLGNFGMAWALVVRGHMSCTRAAHERHVGGASTAHQWPHIGTLRTPER